jgi:hypothetical protein
VLKVINGVRHVTFEVDEDAKSRTERNTEKHTNDSMKIIDAVSKEQNNERNECADIPNTKNR